MHARRRPAPSLVAGWHTLAGNAGRTCSSSRRFVDGVGAPTRRSAGDGVARRRLRRRDARARAMAVDAGGDIVLAGWSLSGRGRRTSPALARVHRAARRHGSDGDGSSPVGTAPGGAGTGSFDARRGRRASARITAAGRRRRLRARAAAASPTARPTPRSARRATYARGPATAPGSGGRRARRRPRRRRRARRPAAGALAAACSAPSTPAAPPEPRAGRRAAGLAHVPGDATQALGGRARPGRHRLHRRRDRLADRRPSSRATSANAAPVAALAAPATVVRGRAGDVRRRRLHATPRARRCASRSTSTATATYEFDGGENPLALRSFPAPGTYTVGVRVTDPRGGAATAAASDRRHARGRPVPQPLLGRQGVAHADARHRARPAPRHEEVRPDHRADRDPERDGDRRAQGPRPAHRAARRERPARRRACSTPAASSSTRASGATPDHHAASSRAARSPRCARASGRKARRARGLAVASAAAASAQGQEAGRASCGATAAAASAPRAATAPRRCAARSGSRVDRCDGTLVRVERGKVDVDDLVRPKRRRQAGRAPASRPSCRRGAE